MHASVRHGRLLLPLLLPPQHTAALGSLAHSLTHQPAHSPATHPRRAPPLALATWFHLTALLLSAGALLVGVQPMRLPVGGDLMALVVITAGTFS